MRQNIASHLIDLNEGQINGLPGNPRYIKDESFEKLTQSIIDDPEMLDLRELIVFPYKKRYVIIGGNMRFRAIDYVIQMPASKYHALVSERKDNDDFLSWLAAMEQIRVKKEIPCKILDHKTSTEKLKALLIKDNVSAGSWSHEDLSVYWNIDQLDYWGVEGLPDMSTPEPEPEKEDKISKNLLVECRTLEEMETLFARLQDEGYTVTLTK